MYVNASSPTDGAELVPLNAGILLHWTAAEQQGEGTGFSLHSLSLVARGGDAVAGAEQGTFGEALAWAPTTPLLPNTTYDVTVQSGAGGDKAYAESMGLLWDYSFSFTTGTELLPQVAYAGPLTVDITASETDAYPLECQSMCGGVVTGCAPVGKTALVSAVVHVPAVTGGNTAAGYRGVVDYTFDAPSGLDAHASRPPREPLVGVAYFAGSADGPTDVTVNLKPGSPCFQVAVWDASGQSATTSVCVPEVDVTGLLSEKNAEIAARGDAPPETANAAAPAGSAEPTRGSCTIARTGHHAFTLLGFGALALLVRRRVRR